MQVMTFLSESSVIYDTLPYEAGTDLPLISRTNISMQNVRAQRQTWVDWQRSMCDIMSPSSATVVL